MLSAIFLWCYIIIMNGASCSDTRFRWLVSRRAALLPLHLYCWYYCYLCRRRNIESTGTVYKISFIHCPIIELFKAFLAALLQNVRLISLQKKKKIRRLRKKKLKIIIMHSSWHHTEHFSPTCIIIIINKLVCHGAHFLFFFCDGTVNVILLFCYFCQRFYFKVV